MRGLGASIGKHVIAVVGAGLLRGMLMLTPRTRKVRRQGTVGRGNGEPAVKSIRDGTRCSRTRTLGGRVHERLPSSRLRHPTRYRRQAWRNAKKAKCGRSQARYHNTLPTAGDRQASFPVKLWRHCIRPIRLVSVIVRPVVRSCSPRHTRIRLSGLERTKQCPSAVTPISSLARLFPISSESPRQFCVSPM